MKDKIISILFVSVLITLGFVIFVTKDRDVSFYERRKLMTSDSIKEDFFDNLEDYMSDQFPLRDELISIDSLFNRYILMNKEKNDVYVVVNYLIEKNYPTSDKSVKGFINKLNYINDNYLNNSNVYYSIIPDKSYFLDESKYLKLDFDKVINQINSNLNMNYIDILNDFVLEDYFKSDIHLKQDSYFKVIDKFSKYLNFDYDKLDYKKNTYNEFYGASISKVGSYINVENLDYFTNDIFKKVKVNHLEYGIRDVYDIYKLEEVDAYNVFLSGPSALIQIENENSKNNNELIIFRDSFASSFIPLLIPYYKSITLIDLRYINMNLVSNYIDFNNKDILFLYSTLIVNKSDILKVNI